MAYTTVTTTSILVSLAALGLSACLKPNPLAEALTAANDETDETDGSGEHPGPDDDDDDDDDDDTDGNGMTSGNNGTNGSSGDGMGDGDGDGDPGDGDPGDGDPGDGDPGDGDPGDGDGEPPPLDLGDAAPDCAPLDGFEPACAECLASDCCEVAELCAGEEGCSCLAACVLAGGSSGSCKNQCATKPEDTPALGPLLTCANASCSGAC